MSTTQMIDKLIGMLLIPNVISDFIKEEFCTAKSSL